MTDREQQEWDMKLRKLDAEIANLHAATAKMITENRWYVPVVASAGTAALIGATAAFVRVFS